MEPSGITPPAKTGRTIAACRLIVERTRRITHPDMHGLDLATAMITDLMDIEDSIIGNRQTFPSVTPEQLFEATIRWANEELTNR